MYCELFGLVWVSLAFAKRCVNLKQFFMPFKLKVGQDHDKVV